VGNPLNLTHAPADVMIPSYIITLFTMKSCIGDLDPVQLYHGAANEEYLKIPTYTVINLGGGSIGGG
jgi:hypothetical protein